jgi:hypothetical protein
MEKAIRLYILSIIILGSIIPVAAQRARVVSEPEKPDQQTTNTANTPIPQAVKAKYEGGILGYPNKLDGTINFDQTNERLVFRNTNGKEALSLSYKFILVAYADTKSRRPTAATVVSQVPLPYGLNVPAWFVRKKYRYLTIEFKDPDTQLRGITSFKIDNKEVLAQTLAALGESAKLKQRGTAYIRVQENVEKKEMKVDMNQVEVIQQVK